MGWFWAGTNNNDKAKCPVDRTTKCPVDTDTGKSPLATSSCPVKHTQPSENKCPVPHEKRSSWFAWGAQASEAKKATTSPESHSNDDLNPMNMMPEHTQQRVPGQKIPLPTERTKSSIPRGARDSDGVWEYPSPQQMFNAMVRKAGGASDSIPEDAVESMVDVHNFLNEGAWEEILKWELPYIEQSGKMPRLLKFQGRSEDMTPRARWYQMMARVSSKYDPEPPFDRHDWTVLRQVPGKDEPEHVRYVIDYYSAADESNGMPAFYLDVRPALDSVGSAVDRFEKFAGPVWNKAMGKPPAS